MNIKWHHPLFVHKHELLSSAALGCRGENCCMWLPRQKESHVCTQGYSHSASCGSILITRQVSHPCRYQEADVTFIFNFKEGREREREKGVFLICSCLSLLLQLSFTSLLIYQQPDQSDCHLVRILLLQAPALSLPLKAALTKSLLF